jgi:hypothetical protein
MRPRGWRQEGQRWRGVAWGAAMARNSGLNGRTGYSTSPRWSSSVAVERAREAFSAVELTVELKSQVRLAQLNKADTQRRGNVGSGSNDG